MSDEECSGVIAPLVPRTLSGSGALAYCGRTVFASAGRTLLLRVQLVSNDCNRLSLRRGPPCLCSGGSLRIGRPAYCLNSGCRRVFKPGPAFWFHEPCCTALWISAIVNIGAEPRASTGATTPHRMLNWGRRTPPRDCRVIVVVVSCCTRDSASMGHYDIGAPPCRASLRWSTM